jgi:fermentation-respiration switch protein FrsA (DUF1100 family)
MQKKQQKKKRGFLWSLLRLGIITSITLILTFSAAVFFSDQLIFQPPRQNAKATETMLKLPVNDKIFITAIYLKVPNAEFTILYSHGNAEDLFALRQLPEEYAKHGYSMFIYDYEGYGASNGYPGETQCYRDIETAYRYLTEKLKISPEKIVIYGRSVGSGPACYLAEKFPAAALILESPFASAFSVITGSWPLPGDKFPNLRRVPHISIPILIFHGDQDRVINISHSRKLHTAANSPKRFVEISGAGHYDLIDTAQEIYWRELKAFLSEVAIKKKKPSTGNQ